MSEGVRGPTLEMHTSAATQLASTAPYSGPAGGMFSHLCPAPGDQVYPRVVDSSPAYPAFMAHGLSVLADPRTLPAGVDSISQATAQGPSPIWSAFQHNTSKFHNLLPNPYGQRDRMLENFSRSSMMSVTAAYGLPYTAAVGQHASTWPSIVPGGAVQTTDLPWLSLSQYQHDFYR